MNKIIKKLKIVFKKMEQGKNSGNNKKSLIDV